MLMANKKKHLQKEERYCIERMLKVNRTISDISRVLGRGISTISEEVNDNGGRDEYEAQRANHRAYIKQYRKKRNCNKISMDGHLSRFVEKSLSKGWSPETISDRLKIQSGIGDASGKSIRKFVNKRPSLERFLFWERNKMKTGRKRSKGIYLSDLDRKFIENRPFKAEFEYGHWEGDFIVSSCNSWVLLVLIERYSKFVRLELLPNRNNDLINQTVVNLLQGYLANSLTLDNDIAFLKWKQLEKKSNIDIYFCHPYCSYEKGLVENTNRWIRQFIKKKTNLQLISKKELKSIENWFNHTPRQCLDGYTPYEVMMEKECGKMVESLEVKLPEFRIWG